MKRFALIMAVAVTLSGCDNDRFVSVYTDQDGCQYLMANTAYLTPRMGRDGHQICTPVKEG